MSDLKREILVNDVLERAAALSYYLLFALVPAVGQGGNSVKLQTFAEQLAGVGRDGIRGVL